MRAYAPGRASRRTLLIGDWRYSLTGRGLFTFPPPKGLQVQPRIKSVFPLPPGSQRILDMHHSPRIEVRKFLQAGKLIINRLFVTAELERHRKVFSGLDGKVIGRLVVELVLAGKPYTHTVPYESGKDLLVNSGIIPGKDKPFHLIRRGFMVEVMLHIGNTAVA